MAVVVPNTVFEYSIDAEGTFPNRKVDIPSFIEEIQASGISQTLVAVSIHDGYCRVEFAADLTDAEILILDGLVTSHDAIPNGEPHTLPYIWQVKNPVANQAEVKMNVMGLAGAIDEYKMMRPATLCGVQIRLKNALTAGTLTVVIAKNGVATVRKKIITPAMGRYTGWLLSPGKLTFEKGGSIGIRYATSADMLPTGDNELDVHVEASWMQ